MPLWNLFGPVGDMYCFSNTYSMLVKIDLLWASLEDKSHVPYCQFKRLLYFICHKHLKQVYFGMCFLSNQAHLRLPYCGAYFQVRTLAYIDHTIVSIASLFAAIKIHISKIKVIGVTLIFIELYRLHNLKKISVIGNNVSLFLKMRKGKEGGGGG